MMRVAATRSARRGSAALEFALTLPLILALAYAGLELPRMIAQGEAVSRAVHHGVAVGTQVHEPLPASGTTITAAAEAATTAALAEMGVPCASGCTVNAVYSTESGWEVVTVTAVVPYDQISSFPWASGSLTRTATELTVVQNP